MAGIRLDQVRKIYDNGFVAVDGIDLEIRDGEFMVLVGPSGCGKTTSLRMIAGLEEVTGGDIRLGDRSVIGVHPKDRDIAMVFQSYALYPHLSVRRNMAFALERRGWSSDRITTRITEASRILGLDEHLDKLPRALSGGQRQRVALGRAIVRQPQAFLFDEPLSNLDAKLRGEMRVEIKTLQRRLGTTAVYVTHDQTEAMTLGDRITVMSRGHIQQIGTPMEVYDRPANRFVASFLGSPVMNFLPVHRDEHGHLRLPDGTVLVPPKGRRVPPVAGDGLVLGLRPEHLVVDSDGPLAARVTLVESMGDRQLAYLQIPGIDAPVVMCCQPRPALVADTTVRVSLDLSAGHLFTGGGDHAPALPWGEA